MSTVSLASIGSLPSSLKRTACENTPPPYASPSSNKIGTEVRASPLSQMSARESPRSASIGAEKRSLRVGSPAQSSLRTCISESTENLVPLTRIHTPDLSFEHVQDIRQMESPDETATENPQSEWPLVSTEDHQQPVPEGIPVAEIESGTRPAPFRRWVNTLRRRNADRKDHAAAETSTALKAGGLSPPAAERVPPRSVERSRHRKSNSYSSSTGFVTAIKTASVTLASVSVGPLRRRNSRSRIDHRSSGNSDVRTSIDSHAPSLAPIIDEATWLRSVQRRKILEEIVSTEESYVSDMKAFVNVYLTLLTSMPVIAPQLRASVEQTVTQIVQLHEDLLLEMRKSIPDIDHSSDSTPSCEAPRRPKHARWHSADIAPPRMDARNSTRKLRHSFEIGRMKAGVHTSLTANTHSAADVAKIFNTFMRRFLIYEAWAAQSESMHTAVISTYRTIPTTVAIERGLEVLAHVEGSIRSKGSQSRKGLTLLDLLIKPIQRVCKYPLLFESLCKQTPACDDPVAHNEIQKVLIRLREMTDEINKATDNPQTRQLVDATWTLQDRLIFDEHISPATSPTITFRLLGRVVLCGALHVVYETRDGVKGQFMLCVLYRSCLLLATVNRNTSAYTVLATIPLVNGGLDEPDNGRGLQCHTAPHTWKLVFESQHRLCELLLSACSQAEEEVWRAALRMRITAENHDFSEGRAMVHDLFCSMPPDLRSIGSAFGQAESLARRISIQRAATLGPSRATTRQVILRNTQAQRQPCESYRADTMPARSQTLISTGHIPTLAPRRAERIRLETVLSDVWTKDAIPYPGMLSRRAENTIRASANSMMRKLSMASIASNFSKRSMSFASTSNSIARASAASKDDRESQASQSSFPTKGHPRLESAQSSCSRKVDFHTAPDAFLPQDFELQQSRQRRPKTASESRTKSFTSRMAELSLECRKNLRPMTPIISSAPPTPTPARDVPFEAGMTFEEALARPSLATEAGIMSPRKERKRLIKLAKSSEFTACASSTLMSEKRPEGEIGTAQETAGSVNDKSSADETRESQKEPTKQKKPNKVKSVLFRLWSG